MNKIKYCFEIGNSTTDFSAICERILMSSLTKNRAYGSTGLLDGTMQEHKTKVVIRRMGDTLTAVDAEHPPPRLNQKETCEHE